MSRMFQVLGFWALVIGMMFLAGNMWIPAALFGAKAALFIIFGCLKYTEKTYMYLFATYMILAFVSINIYATLH